MAAVRLIRHATLLLGLGGTTFLVDPMLDPAGARPPVRGTPNERRNPLVELPEAAAEIVAAADAVLVSHLHADHLDETGARLVAGARLPVLCQPGDGPALRERDLADVTEIAPAATHGGVEIHRTGGRHGHGDLADQLGPVSGFVLRAPGEPAVYVAGDTVWCDEVERALQEHRPDVVVVNAGGATFTGAPPITMDSTDVVRVAEAAPDALVVAVHLDAINHCLEGREALLAAVAGRRVAVPEDGETVTLP